ncbi:MAG: hypothetical protein ABSH10_08475 [Phycisphaerae bacterium]
MVLSKRERYALIGTAVAVTVLAVDRLAVAPLLAWRSRTDDERAHLTSEWDRATALLARRDQVASHWRQMVASGMKSDPGEAESQVLHAVRDWAEEAGVSLSLLKPDRLAEKSPLPEIAFQAFGTGKMKAVARLLWRIQTAAIPLKVTEVLLSTHKEGTDDLSFQLRLSTVYATTQPAPASLAARSQPQGGL